MTGSSDHPRRFPYCELAATLRSLSAHVSPKIRSRFARRSVAVTAPSFPLAAIGSGGTVCCARDTSSPSTCPPAALASNSGVAESARDALPLPPAPLRRAGALGLATREGCLEGCTISSTCTFFERVEAVRGCLAHHANGSCVWIRFVRFTKLPGPVVLPTVAACRPTDQRRGERGPPRDAESEAAAATPPPPADAPAEKSRPS
mmetsp:Transcript_28269/g.71144  ORF Transcript_28269/g.71144 Transcript_28269/m.71144 type:complete len:204 (+) Transcript_28269:1047-1658(+)